MPRPIGFISAKANSAVFEVVMRNGYTQRFTLAAGAIPVDFAEDPVYFVGYSDTHLVVIYGDPLYPNCLSNGDLRGECMVQLCAALGFQGIGT